MLLIRPSRPPDLGAITAIYAQQVLHGTGTFETEPPTLTEMAARRDEVLAKQLPFLVAEETDAIIGFAYCSWFKARPAYRYSAEDSIYLSPAGQRRGLGRALLTELAAKAEAAGVRKLIAVIGDSANAGSIGLHHSVGFQQVGVLTSCGWKFDRWLDVVLMEKVLGAGDHSPPAPLGV